MKKLLYSLFLAAAFALPLGAEVRLAEGGKTDYTIVCKKSGDKRLAAAVKDLAVTLEKITGAKFPVKEAADGPKIVIAQLPSSDTKPLAEREVRAKSVGKDLYIYGEGVQGNFDAIYGFLESQLGGRWSTASARVDLAAAGDLFDLFFGTMSGDELEKLLKICYNNGLPALLRSH